jgi:hypothetical protein
MTECQIIKRKAILESPYISIQNKIKIFNFGDHITSYWHLIGWSEMDDFPSIHFDASGIATQN